MHDRSFAEAAERNAEAILAVLRHELRASSTVLEIGSGTGQHAVRFASELKHLRWQTADLEENHPAIDAWIRAARLPNVCAPISLDVTTARISTKYDAVFSANTAHIMSMDAVICMFALVGRALRPEGIFCLYGPFRRFKKFNAESNARFDASLRARDRRMGIRDLEELEKLGVEHGMHRNCLYAVPSNNLVVVWKKVKREPKQ